MEFTGQQYSKICLSGQRPKTATRQTLEAEAEEHPDAPLAASQLQVVAVAGYRRVADHRGTCKLVAPGVEGGGAAGDDDRGEMVVHVGTCGDGGAVAFLGLRRVVVRIDGERRQGREVEQPVAACHEVVGVASAYGHLVETDGHRPNHGIGVVGLHARLRPVEAGAEHPAAGTMPLDVALAEGGGEGEAAVVEGIVEIEVEGILRHLSLADVLSRAAYVIAAPEGVGGEVDHIEAIAVAVGIEIELEVLALARPLGRVDGHASGQTAIGHGHADGGAHVGAQSGVVLNLGGVRRRRLDSGSRHIAAHLDGPSGLRAGNVCGVVGHLGIAGGQQRVAAIEIAVVAAQTALPPRKPLPDAGFALLAQRALRQTGQQQRVGPLEHTPAVGRLAQLETQAVCGLHHRAQRLARTACLRHGT